MEQVKYVIQHSKAGYGLRAALRPNAAKRRGTSALLNRCTQFINHIEDFRCAHGVSNLPKAKGGFAPVACLALLYAVNLPSPLSSRRRLLFILLKIFFQNYSYGFVS